MAMTSRISRYNPEWPDRFQQTTHSLLQPLAMNFTTSTTSGAQLFQGSRPSLRSMFSSRLACIAMSWRETSCCWHWGMFEAVIY